MGKKLSKNGQELAEALTEVLADVTGAVRLEGRSIDVPNLVGVKATPHSAGG